MSIKHFLISTIALTSSLGLFANTAEAQMAGGNQARTILVNCSNGDSIQNAIERTQPWRPLRVDILGVCIEEVEITRDDITLRGMDDSSGITSSTDTAVFVLGGQRILIEHLTLSGPEAALATDSSYVTLIDVTIEGSNFNGIDAVDGSNIVIEDSRVRNNGLDGILIEKSGTLSMFNTVVSNNTRGGIGLNKNSSSVITDSEISENQNGFGIEIGDNSSAHIKGSTLINGNGQNGVTVTMHSTVRIFNDPVITGNGQNGIFLTRDAGAELIGSVTIGGNADVAVLCDDEESSIIVQDNTNISQAVMCTGF